MTHKEKGEERRNTHSSNWNVMDFEWGLVGCRFEDLRAILGSKLMVERQLQNETFELTNQLKVMMMIDRSS